MKLDCRNDVLLSHRRHFGLCRHLGQFVLRMCASHKLCKLGTQFSNMADERNEVDQEMDYRKMKQTHEVVK